jgi:hypothetical protein
MTRAGPAYAVRRALRGSLQPLPLYRIDQLGQAHEVAKLLPVYPAGCAVEFTEPLDWPLDENMRDGLFDGLPTGCLIRSIRHHYTWRHAQTIGAPGEAPVVKAHELGALAAGNQVQGIGKIKSV